MDRIILIQGVAEPAAGRLLSWTKRFDLGVSTVVLSSPADAVTWFSREGVRADLAFVSVDALLDPKIRGFWAGRQGGAVPLVAVGSATDGQALEQLRGPERFPEAAETDPPSIENLRRRLSGALKGSSTVFLWDPHDRYPRGLPPYLVPFGISRLRRSAKLGDFLGEDRSRLSAVVAELSVGDSTSPILWSEWSRVVGASGVPNVAVFGSAFVAAMAGYQALAGWLAPNRIWNGDAGIGDWDEARPELWQAVERGRVLTNFLREADVFLKRGVVQHALGILEHAVAVHPAAAPLWNKLGEAWSAEGDETKSLECWRRALRLEPGNLLRWMQLADAETMAGHGDAALAVVREGAERFCWDVALRSRLGSLFRSRGDSAAAGIELARATLLGAASRI